MQKKTIDRQQEIGVGLIGTGRHGSRYAGHIIADVGGLKLTAISRRSAIGRRQAEKWGASYYADWRRLVDAPEVDAVIVAATPNLNCAIAELCAAKGKPVLIEKPLATTALEAGRIVEVCRSSQTPLTVGHTLRFNTAILALRRRLADAGPLHFFHASQRLEKTLHDWLDDPSVAGAGVILHTAVHVFDALRFITGREVKRVKAIRLCRHNRKCEDLFMAILEMDGGLMGTVDASKVGPARVGRYEFVGEYGQLQGDQVHNYLQLIDGARISDIVLDGPVSTIVPLLSGWYKHLTGQGSNPVPGEEGAAAVAIAEACLRSAEKEQWAAVFKSETFEKKVK